MHLHTANLTSLVLAALLVGSCTTGVESAVPDRAAVAAPGETRSGPELVLAPPDDSGRFTARLSIVNHGPDAVTVVLPGDGSTTASRTPSIEWVVTDAKGESVRQETLAYCGNTNSLHSDEIVELRAGDSVRLGRYVGFPRFGEAPPHTVEAHYAHDPDIEWTGVRLDEDQRLALDAVPPLALKSNSIVVE